MTVITGIPVDSVILIPTLQHSIQQSPKIIVPFISEDPCMETTPEIRRERVQVSPNLTVKELTSKYGISVNCARVALKRGWLVKNYSKKQVIIDRENFRPEICYSIAKQVFYKNFRWNPVAQSMKEDLLQEAVTLMFMQSGKIKEGATEKYNWRYGYWWCAHNAMLSFLKTWERQMKYNEVVQDFLMPMMKQRKFYSPEHGWIYC